VLKNASSEWNVTSRRMSRVVMLKSETCAEAPTLIQFHGWNDAAIPARTSIEYFETVRRETPNASGFYRLYMGPGMLHCGGGQGPQAVDWLSLVAAWVERGSPPGLWRRAGLAVDGLMSRRVRQPATRETFCAPTQAMPSEPATANIAVGRRRQLGRPKRRPAEADFRTTALGSHLERRDGPLCGHPV
jgi:hypothetical protein